jgi:hypothetical protein
MEQVAMSDTTNGHTHGLQHGDECPLCQCGTVEIDETGAAACRGECGAIMRTAAEAALDTKVQSADGTVNGTIVKVSTALDVLTALKSVLSHQSDHYGDAIWVDENYDPAEPEDPPAVRYCMTPREITLAKARAIVAKAEGRS